MVTDDILRDELVYGFLAVTVAGIALLASGLLALMIRSRKTQRPLPPLRPLAGPCWFLEGYGLDWRICQPASPIDGRLGHFKPPVALI